MGDCFVVYIYMTMFIPFAFSKDFELCHTIRFIKYVSFTSVLIACSILSFYWRCENVGFTCVSIIFRFCHLIACMKMLISFAFHSYSVCRHCIGSMKMLSLPAFQSYCDFVILLDV